MDTAEIALKADDLMEFKLEYFSIGHHPGLRLQWSSPSMPQHLIPQNQLYTAPNRAPRAKPQALSIHAGKSLPIKLSAFGRTGNPGLSTSRMLPRMAH